MHGATMKTYSFSYFLFTGCFIYSFILDIKGVLLAR